MLFKPQSIFKYSSVLRIMFALLVMLICSISTSPINSTTAITTAVTSGRNDFQCPGGACSKPKSKRNQDQLSLGIKENPELGTQGFVPLKNKSGCPEIPKMKPPPSLFKSGQGAFMITMIIIMFITICLLGSSTLYLLEFKLKYSELKAVEEINFVSQGVALEPIKEDSLDSSKGSSSELPA